MLYAGGNTVQGNYFGTNLDGNVALTGREPKFGTVFGSGVKLDSPNNLLGGTTAGARNIIAGTAGLTDGLAGPGTPAYPHHVFGNLIQGNYIGTDVTGAIALGGNVGIQDCPDTTIGGTTPAARNIISGSQRAGIMVLSTEDTAGGTLIQGNYIGTDATGAHPLGNQADGIFVGSLSLQCKIDNNLIAFNGGSGINIPAPPSASPGRRITIASNAIHSNQSLGIDLGVAGVTDNDVMDADAGANELQNFPVLSAAAATATAVTVSGTLNTTANTACTLQFFYGGNRQGHQLAGGAPILLGEGQAKTDGNGNTAFTFSFAAPAGLTGGWVTATATDAAGNMSEFADCVSLAASNCTFLLSLASQSFKAGGGAGSVDVTGSACDWAATSNNDWITIASGATGKGSGTVHYAVAAHTGAAPRTGTLTIAGKTLVVTQSGAGPLITAVTASGKHLVITGDNFDDSTVILLNGEPQKTIRDDPSMATLRGKKLAKRIAPGQMVNLQVSKGDGVVSPVFPYTR